MFNLKNWWRRGIIKRKSIDDVLWQQSVARLPLLSQYNERELERLRELATLFLHYKTVEGASGLEITNAMRVLVAAQACMPILNLDIDWYDGWYSVIVYPSGFRPSRVVTDEAGVVHESELPLSGEAWDRGPVILSWVDAASAGQVDGQNLVIHEFVHKLDMLNGAANGMPPLHSNMSIEKWSGAFSAAYEDFQNKIDIGQYTPFNRYGASAPAEFFAVLSEVFFELPHTIRIEYPDVYAQLCGFYRQQPI